MADSACCETARVGPPDASAGGSARIAVLGAGNVLMGDDGVGVAALEALCKAGVPEAFPGVHLVEAGTAAFDAVALLDDSVTRLIVIDAVRGGGPPGAVYRFTLGAVTESVDPQRASLHQVTLIEALRMAELTGRGFDEIVVIGVQPDETSWGAGLSEAVRERIPDIVALAGKEIGRLGR